MGRAPCCSDHSGLKRGTWTADEDQKLVDYIQRHGCGNWRNLPKHAGLLRCWKSCRLRWVNYLRPDIKRGMFSSQEELLIIQLHAQLGNKWSSIATCLPGRTDNEIKNYWNTRLKKRLDEMGIDPLTHMPKQDRLLQRLMTPLIPSYMSQLVQYDMARVEAEALLRSRLNATVDSFISQICFDSAANHSVETDSTIQQLLLQRQDHQSSTNRCSVKCSPRHDHKIDCTRSIVQNSPSSSGTTPEKAGFMIPNDRSLLQSDQIMKCHSNTEIPNSILPDDVDHNFFDSTSDERPTAEYNYPNALSPWPEDQPLAITDDQNAWECTPPIASRCSDIFSDAVRPITENIESSSSSTNSFERPFPISELLTGALDFITDPPCSAGREASEFCSEEGNDYWRNMLLNSILGQSTN